VWEAPVGGIMDMAIPTATYLMGVKQRVIFGVTLTLIFITGQRHCALCR